LREILLNGTIDWSAPAEAMLHFAARAEHVERTIRPALAAGTWVVCDRFADSTMAYQGYGQGADREMIAILTRLIDLKPDLTLVLDLPPEIAAGRVRGRGGPPDRYDRLGDAFHARVAEGFRHIAAAEPDRCVLVDASGAEAAVHGAILNLVEGQFLQA
ncbi:MAG: dTMP kinase, partial [Acetobacteraceae bacterium]|nr:dTMP kinase [Acetobacteraceae bacterium]